MPLNPLYAIVNMRSRPPRSMILPRIVVTGPGVLEQIPAIIAELDIPERGLIVCDKNTLEIAGKQVIEYLEGRSTAQQAFERTKIMTRRMAKMQRTWMRRFANVHWLPCDDRDTSKIIDEALGALRCL